MPAPVIANLRSEHSQMRSVLALIGVQLDRMERGEEPDYVLMANALYYMRKFPSQVHHPKEDLIFDRLVAGDPAQKQEVEQIREQHQQIYELEEWLMEMTLNNPIKGTTALKRLIEFGRHYLQIQREHCMTEEKTMFPRAAEALTAKDWAAVERLVQQVEDPLFGKHRGERYQTLYDYIMRESANT